MDFYRITVREEKDGAQLIFADWIIDSKVTDILVNRGAFQAVWDENAGLWSTDEYDVARLVDRELRAFEAEYLKAHPEATTRVRLLRDSSTKGWMDFQNYLSRLPQKRQDLNPKLVFENTEVDKFDYATFRLPYPLEEGTYDAWDELVGTLYDPEERAKIEWAIGAIVSGDSTEIQKFLVLYGKPGSGKSTILNVIEKMFDGYVAVFNARELVGNNNAFSLAPFAENPLVGIQQDGDLSSIEDNTQLNMITAHDKVIINAKYSQPYPIKSKAFLFMASNEPVKIKNAKAGIMRRLIDVTPSNRLIPTERYHSLVEQINFELGAIAYHCWKVYLSMGKNYYMDYTPRKMQYATDFFYNFVESAHDVFKAQDGTTLKQAWDMYKEYCDESGVRRWPMYRFRSELENYFEEMHERIQIEGERVRNYYSGYKDIMRTPPIIDIIEPYSIELHMFSPIDNDSTFNQVYADQPAQYAKSDGTPALPWEKVKTTLREINTYGLHYVKVPEHHIVIDFDLVDEDGEKDLERNLEEASKWPPTYTELSKSGKGVHLHYIYNGDVHDLANVFDVGVEIKTLLGGASLRRMVTQCNDLPIETISSGLPKKEKRMIDENSIKSEKHLRDMIERNLQKEFHPGTKPSVDFIHHLLEEAFENGVSYDVRDLRPKILAFAAKSTNQAPVCIKTVQSMRWVGQENMPPPENDDGPLIFFDVEVYPNLLMVCWKKEHDDKVVRMINPRPHDIEPLLHQRLIGFNNRRYDNHILYARYLGYTLDEVFKLSQKLINNNKSAPFGEAYNLSYTDIYDFSSVKQSLKKFMIQLGIFHMELDIPWDEPVDEALWPKIEDYCVNDVIATEAVFHARKADFVARQILAELSGLTVNHSTQSHTAKIIFGDDPHPQQKFEYTDLSKEFEGYVFDGKESTYRGETVGEGGYVYAEPGIYEDVVVLDIASMHPTSIIQLNLFGRYTENFRHLVEARLAIKSGDFAKARSDDILGGRLEEFLVDAEDDTEAADALAYALKIVINIVYGLTSARFDNPFKDIRNKDNIVAKRGALFMIELKHVLQEMGVQVIHIKTDSVKLSSPDQETIEFIKDFGTRYGYTFEMEARYEKFCLVNDAVYIAREFIPGDHSTSDDEYKWHAVGKQFQHPYVFKTLFTHESPAFEDFCETRQVQAGTMYLDTSGKGEIESMVHIGRTGVFVPVKYGGGQLLRVKDGKGFHVTGTKGYNWVTRDVAANREMNDDLHVDMDYFERLATEAREAIEKYGPFEDFVN